MPIFEYECRECHTVTEELVRRRDDEKKVTCHRCGSAKVRKLLSAAAVAVKQGTCTGAPSSTCDPRCRSSSPGDMPPCCQPR